MKIEIIGLAGSGKSTVTNTLVLGNSKITKVVVPTTNLINTYPFFTKSFFSLMPRYLRLPTNGDRKYTAREMAWLMIVNSWSKNLERKQNSRLGTLLLDQGPVFLLTNLYCFGPSYMHSEGAEKFWQPIFKTWARTLDMVVLLDAENECLYQRINSRSKGHIMKGKDREVVFEFLNRWREGYNEILKKLSVQPSSPRILKIDTEKVPVDRVCRLIKMEIINFNSEPYSA